MRVTKTASIHDQCKNEKNFGAIFWPKTASFLLLFSVCTSCHTRAKGPRRKCFTAVVNVPFFEIPALDSLKAFHTASRSIVAKIGGIFFGVKMPTNKPFGPKEILSRRTGRPLNVQDEKTQLEADIRYAVPRSTLISQLENQLNSESRNRVLLEIFSVFEKSSRNGFIVRDLSLLQDGNYYFPAHIIWRLGHFIAAKNRTGSDNFWQKNWAQRIGEFQAIAFLRWGNFPAESVFSVRKRKLHFVLRPAEDVPKASAPKRLGAGAAAIENLIAIKVTRGHNPL